MDVRITKFGASVFIVSVYSLSDKTKREAFCLGIQQCLLGHKEPMLIEGDVNCTMVSRIDRSFVSFPIINDSLALRILQRQA